jgi:hypothetical protein
MTTLPRRRSEIARSTACNGAGSGSALRRDVVFEASFILKSLAPHSCPTVAAARTIVDNPLYWNKCAFEPVTE